MVTLLLSQKVRELRDYQSGQLPVFDQPNKKVYQLTYEDVLDAHFAIADFFFREDYGLGGVGFRSVDGFLSTIDRQFPIIGGLEDPSEFEVIATLMFGIAKNHPFHDANKRTALLCMLLQMHRLGRVPTKSESELENFIVSIADNSIQKKSAYKELKKKGNARPEITYISEYLQKNSRRTARLNSMFRFREIRQLIEKNGFKFMNAFKGTIDIVRVEEHRIQRFFFGDRIERRDVVVTNIAYHGEGAEVPDNTVRHIRQVCGLTDQDGFDGDVLLRDKQPTFQLIQSYRTALQNLAYR